MVLITSSWYLDTIILLLVLWRILHVYTTRKFGYWERKGLEYVKPKSIFGNISQVVLQKLSFADLLLKFHKKMKMKCHGIWLFDRPSLIVHCPNLARKILEEDFEYFSDRNTKCCDAIASKTLYCLKSEEWEGKRYQYENVFSKGMVRNNFEVIKSVALVLVDKIKAKSKFDAKDLSVKFYAQILNSILKTEKDCFEDNDVLKAHLKLFKNNFLNCLKETVLLFLPEISKKLKLRVFSEGVVKRYLKLLENMKSQEAISRDTEINSEDSQMKKEVLSHLIGNYSIGFEKSSISLAFLLYELALNQEVQTKLKKEIECEIDGNDFKFEVVNRMKYLGSCIKEILRKYPALPFIERVCTRDYKISERTVIEKGTPVFIPLLGFSRSEENFKDAGKFLPERFEEDFKTEAYMPFGSGRRQCLGLICICNFV